MLGYGFSVKRPGKIHPASIRLDFEEFFSGGIVGDTVCDASVVACVLVYGLNFKDL